MPQGRIVGLFVSDSGTLIQILLGAADGIDKGWTGKLVADGRDLEAGQFTVLRVSAGTCVAKVPASIDEVKRATHVVLAPP
jgi:hypothetical protein